MEKQKAQEILGAARERGAVVLLYLEGSRGRFSGGFVLAVSDEHVVLENLNSNGFSIGWQLRELDEIYRIDSGGRYEETLLSLYRARQQQHLKTFLPPTDLSSDLKTEILLAAQSHDYAVRLYPEEGSNVEGFVREVTVNTVTLDVFDENGQSDGETTLNLEKVETIKVHDFDLQDLKLLARWHDLPPLS